jgi:cytoskeletal protein RodZ
MKIASMYNCRQFLLQDYHMTISTKEEFLQLGEIFKRKRQEKNLTLKEVESAISIRIHHLVAIEEGNFGKLISPIYAQGFIKKYALFLELDSEGLLRQYPHVLKMLYAKGEETEEFAYGVGTLEMRGTSAGDVKWLPNYVWVVISLGALICIWFLGRFFGFF